MALSFSCVRGCGVKMGIPWKVANDDDVAWCVAE